MEKEIFKSNSNQELLIKTITSLRVNKDLRNIMRDTPRFERYFIADGEKNRDMNEIGHALNTYQISQKLTGEDQRQGFLDDNQKARIRITALIHDLGELGEGDVSYDTKNAIDEEKETEFFINKISDFFPSLGEKEINQLNSIYMEIAHSKNMNNKETKYFNMIERIGYLTTAIEEFQKGKNNNNNNSNVDWQWICDNVIHHQSKYIKNIMTDYKSADIYLTNNIEDIKEMVDYTNSHRKDSTDEDFQIWHDIFLKKIANK